MSHEVESMAYNMVETPWHGLGKPVPGDLTVDQMLEAADLNWTVDVHNTFIEVDGERIQTTRPALVRSSDKSILTIISNDWKPVQNSTAFEFFRDFVEEGKMRMETAGSLKSGKMVWALARIDDSFELFGGDRVESYLLFSNPHEYGKSIDIRFTPIRVVCNNTLTMALGNKSDMQVRLNHRNEFDPELVRQTLGIAHSKMETYKEMAEFLGSKRYDNSRLRDFISQVFQTPVESMTPTATACIDKWVDEQPGAEYAEGTWWQAVNAVTYMTDHILGRNPESRLYNIWYGGARTRKLNAMNLAMEMAESA